MILCLYSATRDKKHQDFNDGSFLQKYLRAWRVMKYMQAFGAAWFIMP